MPSKNGPDQGKQLPSRRIADALRQSIMTGELSPGSQLPSERTLATEYGTARNTAREAVRLLVEEGLVVAHHGRGAYVRPSQPLIRLGNDRYSLKYRGTGLSPFLIECQKQGKTGRFEVLSIDTVPASTNVAVQLKINVNELVLRRENIFYADDDPVYRVTTYIPWTIAENTDLSLVEIPHSYGIHGVLEDKGFTMARLEDTITARMPTPDESRYLNLMPGVPVLDIWHVSITDDAKRYEATRFVMRADMNALVYNAPIE